MNDKTETGVHWSFWAISAFALIWNVLGSANYLSQMNADIVASLPETHRAIIDGRPVWATGGFAIAVFGGALGGLLLLLRKSTAVTLFIVSLLGTIVTMVHTVNVARSPVEFSFADSFVMIVLPLLVVAFLIWYSKQALNKDWIS
jgi:hypothetical protein